MEIDDDILVVKDSKPKEPLEDPLSLTIPDNIINLDSSDEELPICKPNQTLSGMRYNAKARNQSGTIDLDAEDSGPKASIESAVNLFKNVKSSNNIDNVNGQTNFTKQASALHGATENNTMSVSQKIENNQVVKKHYVYDNSNATTPVFKSVCTVDESHEPIAFIIPKPSACIQNSLQHMETHNSCAIDKSFRQKCILTADETSQQQNVKSSVKKNNPVRFKSKIITEPNVTTGKKTRNTAIDLNLNVNDYEKRSAITNLSKKKPQSLSSSCEYNVALGLVLNVNNNDKSGNSCLFTPANKSRINDVALDVSVNVNNKGNTATATSGQVVQNIPINTQKLYSCLMCKFQTTKIGFIKSHNCSGHSQPEIPVKVDKTSKNPLEFPNIVFKTNQNVYECKICQINNLDFQFMKTHMCLPECPPLTRISNQKNIGNQMYCCVVCSLQTEHLEILKSHTCTLAKFNQEKKRIELSPFKQMENSEQDSSGMSRNNLQKIFSCAVCSFQTTDLEIIKCHNCSPSKILTDSGTTTNLKQLENVVQAGSSELSKNELPKVLGCVSCSFRTTDLEDIKSHNCLPLSNSNVDIQGDLIKQMYCCSVCSFQTTNLEIVKSHSCISPKLPVKNNAKARKNIESLESSENNNHKKLETFQGCGSCPFKTKCMCSLKDKNKLPNFNKNSLQESQNITPSEKMYCCVSCSFKTLNFKAVTSHRCRDYLSKSPPIFQDKDISCPLCVKKFHDKYLLFQHLRFTHLKFIRRIKCHYCDELLIDTDLVKHLKEVHKSTDLPSECVTIYECKHCESFLYDPDNVPAHLNAHILFLFDKVASLKILASVGTLSLYSCILCGIHSADIDVMLGHCCQPPSNVLSITSKQLSGQPKKYTRTSEIVCYSCKRNIYKQLLQCECENVYHLTCVDMYARLQSLNEVNNMPNWFCFDCNNENVNNLPAIRDDIDTVDWCLDFANKEYLKELRKQEIIAKELKKINEESERMMQEFQQVKNFIFKSNSEKINNKLVRSVCNIIDSYIGAGCD